MMLRRPFLASCAAIVLALSLGGCGNREVNDHISEKAPAAGGHAHEPKYGGKLVALGEHEGNVELVLDTAAGRLTLYVLDAHAENFVRLPLTSITIFAETPGGTKTLTLQPVGNAAAGEKPGDTSQFQVTEDWLKNTRAFTGRIQELVIKSRTYRDVPFRLPN